MPSLDLSTLNPDPVHTFALLQVSYGIGLPHPLSVYVDTYKTGKLPDEDIQELLLQHFDFRPGFIMTVGVGFRVGVQGLS